MSTPFSRWSLWNGFSPFTKAVCDRFIEYRPMYIPEYAYNWNKILGFLVSRKVWLYWREPRSFDRTFPKRYLNARIILALCVPLKKACWYCKISFFFLSFWRVRVPGRSGKKASYNSLFKNHLSASMGRHRAMIRRQMRLLVFTALQCTTQLHWPPWARHGHTFTRNVSRFQSLLNGRMIHSFFGISSIRSVIMNMILWWGPDNR